MPIWPVHPRYGALAGLDNPTFLDASLLEQAFLRALEPAYLEADRCADFPNLERCGTGAWRLEP